MTVDADATGTWATTDGQAQLVLRGKTDTTLRLGIGVDTSNGKGRIQAADYGTAAMDLLLQPAGGDVGIGTTSPSAKLHVSGTAKVSGLLTAGDVKITGLSWGGSYYVSVDGSGNLFKSLGSSLRYKTAVRDLEENAGAVLDLRPVHFNWASNGQPDIGLIAEEVDKVLTDLVIYDNEGRPDGVKYDKVPLYLLQVVRAQQSHIIALEQRLTMLEETVARMGARTALPPVATSTDIGR